MSSARICLHGHYYQPDRTNPWTGAVDEQPSAAPYHDWNERITAECYAPNARAGNYARTSFNFGPTLLAWLERHAPETYALVLAADRAGRERFGGHGPALAQAWGHSILPLDSERDRRTQVRWGVRDFERRFGRKPAGMWLPETAADTPTLEILADAGINFTILAPHQATRPPGHPTTSSYVHQLPSGREIALCIYDGAIANEIAFRGRLADPDRLAERLLAAGAGFVHVATDGETYGHHHPGGAQSLTRCLDRLEATPGTSPLGVPLLRESFPPLGGLGGSSRLTIYSEYLAACPPRERAAIVERSSWSCVHGVERWRSGCGCCTGLHPGWRQDWRAPLRAAVEWLRDALAPLFADRLGPLVFDPWALRDDYVEVLLDPAAAAPVLERNARRQLSAPDRELALGLLEMQRWALLSFASCAWFFDDISEPATGQAMRSAGRAMELCLRHTGTRLEEGFTDILHNARSNVPELGTGADVYRKVVG